MTPYSGVKECYLFDGGGRQIIKPFAKVGSDLLLPLSKPPHTEGGDEYKL
jgi:hypothetical protein